MLADRTATTNFTFNLPLFIQRRFNFCNNKQSLLLQKMHKNNKKINQNLFFLYFCIMLFKMKQLLLYLTLNRGASMNLCCYLHFSIRLLFVSASFGFCFCRALFLLYVFSRKPGFMLGTFTFVRISKGKISLAYFCKSKDERRKQRQKAQIGRAHV